MVKVNKLAKTDNSNTMPALYVNTQTPHRLHISWSESVEVMLSLRRLWLADRDGRRAGSGVGEVGGWEGEAAGRGLLTLTLSPCAANTGTN